MKPPRPEAFDAFAFPPRPEHLRILRSTLRRDWESRGVAIEVAQSALLVLDELISNAIEHSGAYRGASSELSVRVRAEPQVVEFEFFDPEVPSSVAESLAQSLGDQKNGTAAPPPLDSERGRGLYLVAMGVDQLRVEAGDDGGLRLSGRIVPRA